MFTFYNYPEIEIPQNVLAPLLQKSISFFLKLEPISIIFVSEAEIKRLNKDFRKVDEITDVLSFNFDTEELLGEIYICKTYIQKNLPKNILNEEIIRLIIHGILHLYGYDHKTKFVDRSQKDLENMYIIQESVLDKIIKKLK